MHRFRSASIFLVCLVSITTRAFAASLCYSGTITSVSVAPIYQAPFSSGSSFNLSLNVNTSGYTDAGTTQRQYLWSQGTTGTMKVGSTSYNIVDGAVNVFNSGIGIEGNAPSSPIPTNIFTFRLGLAFPNNPFPPSVAIPGGLPSVSAASVATISSLGPLPWGSYSGIVTGTSCGGSGGPTFTITTASLADATGGQPYSTTLASSGASGGVTWSLAAGTLPTGFTLSSAGVLASTGTPAAAPGSYTFTVRATDSPGAIATRSLTLNVLTGPLSISSLVLPAAQSGALYRAPLVAQNGANVVWSMQGALPAGLLFAPSGEIAGTVPAGTVGLYNITLTATSGVQVATKTVPLVVFGTPEVIDPVVNPLTISLLSGSALSRSPRVLSSRGRPVQGIAADGVSQVLLRQPAPLGAGQVRFAFSDSNATDACTVPTAAVTDSSGGFYDPQSPPVPDPSTTDAGLANLLAVSPSAGLSGAFILAAFRSPIEFARSDADLNLPFRKLYLLRCHLSSNSSLPPIDLSIVRPPLFFVHGFTANARFWNSFTPLVTDTRRYGIHVFDYGQRIRQQTVEFINIPRGGAAIATYGPDPFKSIDPDVSAILTDQTSKTIRHSHLGIQHNAESLLNGIRAFLDSTDAKSFRGGNNPASVPVAAAQVDVVGHSMGGLVTRQLASPLNPGFFAPANFSRGYVRKLITIGTPHLGSPAAAFLMRPENSCMSQATTGVWYDESINLNSVIFADGSNTEGGAGDLRGAGVGDAVASHAIVDANTSKTLRNLPGTIPMALIAGEAGLLVTNLNKVPTIGGLWCLNTAPYAEFFVNSRYNFQFDAFALGSSVFSELRRMRSDAIVPLSSALNVSLTFDQVRDQFQINGLLISSLALAANGRVFSSYLHGAGTNVVFPGQHLLLPDAITGVPTYVDWLLNKSVRDAIFHRNYRRYK